MNAATSGQPDFASSRQLAPFPTSAQHTRTGTRRARSAAVMGAVSLFFLAGCSPGTPTAPTSVATTTSATTAPATTEATTTAATTPTPAPTTPDASQSELKARYGDYPPKNLDNLKDLNKPTFPDTLNGYTLTKKSGNSAVTDVTYSAPDKPAIQVSLAYSPFPYRHAVKILAEPEYHGNALCGLPDPATQLFWCILAGSSQTLEVSGVRISTNADKLFLAEWSNQLYEAL